MKKSIFILLSLYSNLLFCQGIVMPKVPQGISYQAIALNSAGNQLVNTNIKLRISIIDDITTTQSVLYTETHSKTTNEKGLYNLIIGQGTVVTGTFASIDWGKNSKLMKVEMDANGGNNFISVGTTQMQSVPFALYSGKTASIEGNTNINNEIIDNRSGNFAFASTNGVVYVYNAKINEWSSQLGTLDNYEFYGSGLLTSSNENFAFPASNGVVYVYNAKLNEWSSQLGTLLTFGSLGIVRIAGSNGNFAFAATNGVVYVYNARLNQWSSQLGTVVNQTGYGIYTHLVHSKGNFAFAATNGVVYVYNSRLNSWSSQLGSLENGDVIQSFEGNGNFAFAATNGVVYVYNEKNNSWSSQLGNLIEGGRIITSPSN
jgi:hypothetical protein